jgi:2-dehydro-3-deoxyphosphogluconate aldolase/(4S)-4-hydroxy-2-oxoglutarate aldolase
MKKDLPVAEKIAEKGVVAVLMIERVEDAVPVAEALMSGGVDVMELTLRTEAAMEALQEIRKKVPGMTAGIGTILTPTQVKEVSKACAAFGVAPGINPKTIEAAKECGLPFAPGIMTPTDIEQAVGFGCEILKYFPAGSAGGLAHLRNIAAPYAHLGLRYIPLGGINASNMGEYLREPMIAAVGGSWIANKQLIADQNWDAIKSNAREAVAEASVARTY